MIICVEGTMLHVRIVYSLEITKNKKREVVSPWSWRRPLKLPEVVETPYYLLTIVYLGEDEVKYIKEWNCPTRAPLVAIHDELVRQLKAQDHEIVDRAFEQAVNNLGKK